MLRLTMITAGAASLAATAAVAGTSTWAIITGTPGGPIRVNTTNPGTPVEATSANGRLRASAVGTPTYGRMQAAATFRGTPGDQFQQYLLATTLGYHFYETTLTPSADATVSFNVRLRSSTAVGDSMRPAARRATLTPDPSAPRDVGPPALDVSSVVQMVLRLTDLETYDSWELAVQHGAYTGWRFTPYLPDLFTQESASFRQWGAGFNIGFPVDGTETFEGKLGLAAAGRYTLPGVTLVGGRSYAYSFYAGCQVAAQADLRFAPASFAGLSGYCNSSRSAYWDGLSDVTGADGAPLSGFSLMNEGADFDFANASPDIPADFTFGTSILPSSAVPEPAAWAMLIIGFGLVGIAARRRRRPVAVIA